MPTLKKLYDAEADVPAEAKGLYEEKDGKFHRKGDYDFEGLVPNARVEEFRTTNVGLTKRLEKFEGVDPDKYKDLVSREQEILDFKTTKENEIQKRVDQRTSDFKKQTEADLKKRDERITKMDSELRKAKIESKGLEFATAFGKLKKGAGEVLTLKLNQEWSLDENGELVAYEQDGKTVRMGSNGESMRGTEALKRYVEQLGKDSMKFLWEDNAGANGEPGSGSGGTSDIGELNPWDPKNEKMAGLETLKGQIYTKDFKKAERMAAKFGVKLPAPVVTR